MKEVVLKPGDMSQTFPLNNATELIIKNWSGNNCKASATFYPARKGHDTFDIKGNGVFSIESEFTSVSFYWIDCSAETLSFEFETE
jgi:hypothetical protein